MVLSDHDFGFDALDELLDMRSTCGLRQRIDRRNGDAATQIVRLILQELEGYPVVPEVLRLITWCGVGALPVKK